MAQSLASAPEHSSLPNSAARAELIREAVRWIAEHRAEVKALNAEINEFMVKTVKGDLGFKIADFNAVYRVSQLEVADRDLLLDCVREGFAALSIGQVVDWVDAAQATPGRRGKGYAEPDAVARQAGFHDGMDTHRYHADQYPSGAPGHGDYMLGIAEGEDERDRVWALSNGVDANQDAPKRRRGRPRKQPQEAEADAEF
jgi:hypothetical protein